MGYKVALVGSGLVGHAAIDILKKYASFDVDWYLGSKFDTSRTVEGKYLTYGGYGGNIKYWHGVIGRSLTFDTLFDSDRFDAMFRTEAAKFYPKLEENYEMLSNHVFVPYRPIRAKNLLGSLPSNITKIRKSIIYARKSGALWSIKTEEPEWKEYDLLILASGTIGTAKILQRSSLIGDVNFSDHLVSYVGTKLTLSSERYEANKFVTLPSGYFKPINIDFVQQGLLLYYRPAFFDFRNHKTASEYRDIYNNKSPISKLIQSLSPGLIMDAIGNRTGLNLVSTHLNIVSQCNIRNLFKLKFNGMIEINEDSIPRKQEEMSALLPDLDWNNLSKGTIGLHPYGSLIESDISNLENTIIIDASGVSEIGPHHHSFSVYVFAKLYLEDNLKKFM